MAIVSGLEILLVLLGASLGANAYLLARFKKKNKPEEKIIPSPLEKPPPDLRPLLESLEEGVILSQKGGEIITLNQKAASLLGISAKPYPNLYHLLRDEKIEAALEAKRPLRLTKDFYWPSHRTLELEVLPLEAEPCALILRDLTPIRRLSEVRRDFVAHLAHEFRTPLTAIEGYAENLLEEAPPELRADLEIILKNTRRLSKLLKDLQVLSRLELQGIPEEDFEVVELKEIILTALETLFPEASRKDISLKFVPPKGPTLLRASFDDLLRAFINLIENAVKFSPRGGVVEVSIGAQKHWWQIMVRDEGPGIPESEKDRIFERFYRGKEHRHGTGLGLAIVKHVVKAHGGRITLKSLVGKGTTFYIYLPSSPQ